VLPAAQADRVLSALLETSEPMILAQILAYVPRAMRDRITKRLSEISPSEADAIQSLTEVQTRIDTLLAAGCSGWGEGLDVSLFDAKRVAGVVAVANDIQIRRPDVDERPDPA
jgi:hypothetical protein